MVLVLRDIQKLIVKGLWDLYFPTQPFAHQLFSDYPQLLLEHLAIIDPISSNYSGVEYNANIFTEIGFHFAGRGFLPEKSNDFIWMNVEQEGVMLHEGIPQVVLADFRAENVSRETFEIVNRCVLQCKPFNFNKLRNLKKKYFLEKKKSILFEIVNMVVQHFHQRPWRPLSIAQYKQVAVENELLAWVLAFGRCVNHFGILVKSTKAFNSLEAFNNYMQALVELNKHRGKMIKGSKKQGIQQSSTIGNKIKLSLADGEIEIHQPFMEFVWRYPKGAEAQSFSDYTFQGYLADNANEIIESLYNYG